MIFSDNPDVMKVKQAEQILQSIKVNDIKDCQMMKNFHKGLKELLETDHAAADANSIKDMIFEIETLIKMHCVQD